MGGVTSRRSKAAQSTVRKNLCLRIASAFFGLAPNLALGFFLNNYQKNTSISKNQSEQQL